MRLRGCTNIEPRRRLPPRRARARRGFAQHNSSRLKACAIGGSYGEIRSPVEITLAPV